MDRELISRAMGELGKMKTPGQTAARRANIKKALLVLEEKRGPRVCTCKCNPHKSYCAEYRYLAQKRSREKKKALSENNLST